jgi:solute carrier family 25 carnitine/acylcarnitine transporter 20/29
MTAVIPAQNALLFAGYGVGERWASRRDKDSGGNPDGSSRESLLPVFCGGVVGGVLQSFVVSPFELVKIRQQAAGGAVTLAVSTLAGNLGRVGLCTRGLGATLLRDGVPHGVWFAAYEWSKRRMVQASRDDDDDEATTSRRTDAAVPLCAGAFAAAVAWGVGYPADLVKTRVQAQAAAAAAAGGATMMRSAPGLAETCAAMLRESGGDVLRAFYRGFDLKLLRAVPASAVSFFAYEEARRWLERE